MPSTLAQLETRVAANLFDAANTIWATSQLDEAIRVALDEYQAAAPLPAETVIIAPAAGREIALNGITGLLAVTDVWWPYDSTVAEEWPPVRVGYRVYWDDARPVLMLNAKDGAQPALSDELRIFYTLRHTIQNLDSGATTTLRADHESHFVTGATAHAAIQRGADLIEKYGSRSGDAARYEAFGLRRLAEWRNFLAALRVTPTGAEAFPPRGWRLDKWDNS